MEEILTNTFKIDFKSGNPIEGKLKYDECLKLILEIGDQIELLNKHGIGLLLITKKDIIYKNGKYFLNPNLETYPTNNNKLEINKPFKFNKFMAPEFKNIKELPSNVSYNVAFYNLQNIAIELLGLDELIQLNPTKLYFLLKRCSSNDPSYRIFFYI
jgi:hypothetical protein